jgi:hypothetical protein
MTETPVAYRVPADLPQRIIANSERLRKFDARHYRRAVAGTALDLMGFVAAEQAKRAVNSSRASGRGKAAL